MRDQSDPRSRLGWAAALALLAASLQPQAAAAQEEATPGAPYVPTHMDAVVEMLELVNVSAGDTVYDLGSGDGRLPITAARLYGARGVGVELDADLVARSRRNARQAGVDSLVRFRRGDLFETDLRPATVVTLYLFPEMNRRLRPKLLRQMEPGERVVSHDFDMGEWTPDSVRRVPVGRGTLSGPGATGGWSGLGGAASDLDSVIAALERAGSARARFDSLVPNPGPVSGPATLYLWIIPADVGGTWVLRLSDGRTARLRIDQRFQELRVLPVGTAFDRASGRVQGKRISLVLKTGAGRTLQLRGTVRDGRMRGLPAGEARWSARRQQDTDGSILEWEAPE